MSASTATPNASPTAAARFFSVVELTEAVLLRNEVNMRQLFAPQRVNPHFRDTIVGSRTLATKMFLRHEYATWEASKLKVNPLFLEDLFAGQRMDPLVSAATSFTTRLHRHRPAVVTLNVYIAFNSGEADFGCIIKRLKQLLDGPRGLLEQSLVLNMPCPSPLRLRVEFRDLAGGQWSTGSLEIAPGGLLQQAVFAILADCGAWVIWMEVGRKLPEFVR